MTEPRKLIALPKHRVLFAICLVLATVSAKAQPRESKATEGEIAIELFGLIADQSGCSNFVGAWIDNSSQQIRSQCTETLTEAEAILAGKRTKIRFVIDVGRAISEYRRRFGLSSLPKSAQVLAYRLANVQAKAQPKRLGSPLLIYQTQHKSLTVIERRRGPALSLGQSNSPVVHASD